MRKYFGIILLLLSGYASFANDSIKVVAPSKVFEKFILKEIDNSKIKKPLSISLIKTIELLDFRPDTFHVGAYFKKHNESAWIIFEKNYDIRKLINVNLSNAKGEIKLLAILKEFWLTESPFTRQVEDKLSKVITLRKLIYKCDFYYNDDENYIPLARIDTSFSVEATSTTFNMVEKMISPALQYCVDKIDLSLQGSYLKRKRITKEAIQSASQQASDYPILKDSILRKGVYISHQEFINNIPSVIDYNIKTFKNEPPVLYIKDEKGNDFLSRKSWGFCDGKNIYINNGGMIFALAKNNGSFYWLVIKAFKESYSSLPVTFPVGGGWFVYGLEPVSGGTKAIQSLFRLDIDKGEAF